MTMLGSPSDETSYPNDKVTRIRVGWFSSWNSRCGIAEHSKFLLAELDEERFECTVIAPTNELLIAPDEGHVIRCWTNSSGRVGLLLKVLEEQRFDALVIQFKIQADFGWLSLKHLEAVIACCHSVGTKVLIILHSTDGADLWGKTVPLIRIKYSLASVYRILVHSTKDLERLRAFGVDSNVAVIPHGVPKGVPHDLREARRVRGLPEDSLIIGSYGFLLPQKGVDKLIEALALLRAAGTSAKLLLVNALYPLAISQEQLTLCESLVLELGLQNEVIFETRFQPNEVSLELLAACDVIVFPYQVGEDSSSAAVRMGLAARRPILCSPLPIFSDVSEVVNFLPGPRPEDISEGLQAFLRDSEGRAPLASRQDEWLDRHSWRNVGHFLGETLEQAVSTELDQKSATWVGKFIATVIADGELEVRDLKERIAEMISTEDDLKTLINHSKTRINEMTAAEDLLKRRINEITSTEDALNKQIERWRVELNAVYTSHSWRITKPLRYFSLAIQRLVSKGRSVASRAVTRRKPSATEEQLADPESSNVSRLDLSARERLIYLDLTRSGARQQVH